MRSILAAVAVALLGSQLSAQKTKDPPKKVDKPSVPKKITDQLKTFTDRLKETPPELVEREKDEWLKTKKVASEVEVTTETSDFVDKPYTASITWTSITQDTKIYKDKSAAEKSKEWIEAGRKSGTKGVHIADKYTARLSFQEKAWKVDSVRWRENVSITEGRLTRDSPLQYMKKKEDTPWSFAFEDKKDEKPGEKKPEKK